MKSTRKVRAAPARAATSDKKGSKPKKPTAATKSSRDKVRAHRQRLRQRGMRLVQMWLPDTRTKAFAAQAHRDSIAIAQAARDADDQAWLQSVSWWNSPEAKALEDREPSTPWWREDEASE
jgi:hypothetical protein